MFLLLIEPFQHLKEFKINKICKILIKVGVMFNPISSALFKRFTAFVSLIYLCVKNFVH